MREGERGQKRTQEDDRGRPTPALPVREGERGGKRNKEHGKDLETFPVCDYRGVM